MKDIIQEDYPWDMPRDSDEAMNKLILERSQTGFRKSPIPSLQKLTDHAKILVAAADYHKISSRGL